MSLTEELQPQEFFLMLFHKLGSMPLLSSAPYCMERAFIVIHCPKFYNEKHKEGDALLAR
jgi:hypothetical protein